MTRSPWGLGTLTRYAEECDREYAIKWGYIRPRPGPEPMCVWCGDHLVGDTSCVNDCTPCDCCGDIPCVEEA